LQQQRETIITEWFNTSFNPTWCNFPKVFTPNIYYRKSWRPEYQRIDQITRWFVHWHINVTLLQWDIHAIYHNDHMSFVQRTFSVQADNTLTTFDGVSIIEWEHLKIRFFKEYASVIPKYNPQTK